MWGSLHQLCSLGTIRSVGYSGAEARAPRFSVGWGGGVESGEAGVPGFLGQPSLNYCVWVAQVVGCLEVSASVE